MAYWEATMEAILERVGGVDVGQATVVATVLVGAPHERPKKETQTFRTVTRELLDMREWFLAKGVTHVALEGTGIYWRPVYVLLEDAFDIIVGNAHHIKNVPGRKTDVKDSEWLADLARHGLIKRSLVPPKPLRQVRDLLRYRRKLWRVGRPNGTGCRTAARTTGLSRGFPEASGAG